VPKKAPETQSYISATKIQKRPKELRLLGHEGQRPVNQLLELGGSRHIPEPSFPTNSPKNIMDIRSLLLKNTLITMLPDFLGH
jgi:hypothetical protein